MILQKLTIPQGTVYAFMDNGNVVQLYGYHRFFFTKKNAIEAAKSLGLSVSSHGLVSSKSNPSLARDDSSVYRNRVMGPARRRNAPSRMFHAVIDRGGGVQGMFQPEIVGSDASLSTVRVRAKIAADSSGLPVAVMDDRHKVIRVYRPGDGAPDTRRGVPSTRRY